MQITNVLFLILLACVTLVTSVTTSTYAFTFEIAMTGPEGTCNTTDLEEAAQSLTKVVGFQINLYLAIEGILGQVTNVIVTQTSWRRFLGEGNNYEATTAVDASAGKQSDEAGVVRNLAAMFAWKTGGAGICRLCPPAVADARREVRGLLRSSWPSSSSSSPSKSQSTSEAISKAKISAYMNTIITGRTQFIIKRLPLANSSCTGSYDLWSSEFTWT